MNHHHIRKHYEKKKIGQQIIIEAQRISNEQIIIEAQRISDEQRIIEEKNINNNIIILRGETFTGTINNQIKAYYSVIEHVIKPMKKNNLYIFLITYHNENNNLIKNIFSKYNFELIEIKKTISNIINFVNSINKIPDNLLDKADYVLILKNDLYFLQDIDYSRATRDNILFQWNLFHNFNTREMPDNIYYIGGNLIKKFKILINNYKIDYRCKNTLYDMYNFCVRHFGKSNISYLNYIKNPNPNNKICLIRDNSNIKWGNPLYDNIKYMK
jgi:hypothetical protein